ncbi:MAG: hypothetical protein QM831_32620 [Kofleriaceae bacterium]
MRNVLVLMILAAAAHADPRILVMTDEERAGALELSVVNHHATVSTAPAPTAELPLERAAQAQRACLGDGAWAAVFVDGTQVTVVGADGTIRSAPLPLTASARVFAAIAVSLLDELGEAPEPSHPIVEAPPIADVTPAIARVVERPIASRATKLMVETGIVGSPAFAGAQAEITYPLTPQLRLGVFGGVDRLWDGIRDLQTETTAYHFGAELRYGIGAGPGRFELGVIGGTLTGLASDYDGVITTIMQVHDTGGWFGPRFGYTRDYERTSVTFAVAPIMMFDFRGQSDTLNPGLITSLSVGLPM